MGADRKIIKKLVTGVMQTFTVERNKEETERSLKWNHKCRHKSSCPGSQGNALFTKEK